MGRTKAPVRRVTTAELEAWLSPIWQHAVDHFGIADRARYEWNGAESAYGQCHVWDPGRIVFSRPHFRRFLLKNDQHFAAQVVVHEILHGLGIQHDGRIGWSVAKDYPLDKELVDHLYHDAPPTRNVERMLARVERAWERRDQLFCPSTMRPHAVRYGGAFCELCGLLVENVELVLHGH